MIEKPSNIQPHQNIPQNNPITPPKKGHRKDLHEANKSQKESAPAAPYKTYMGMNFNKKQWKIFMKQMAQTIVNQIKNQQARMIKAMRKLKKSETGQE